FLTFIFVNVGQCKVPALCLNHFPFCFIGGILALHLTGINFGISAGVGFIALFGICVQNGVILIGEFHKQVKKVKDLNVAIAKAIEVRTRRVVMTALMAAVGLVPAAISTGI